MARLARVDIFTLDEIAICHVCARTVRKCYPLGEDPVTGKNDVHRKDWIELFLRQKVAQRAHREDIGLVVFDRTLESLAAAGFPFGSASDR